MRRLESKFPASVRGHVEFPSRELLFLETAMKWVAILVMTVGLSAMSVSNGTASPDAGAQGVLLVANKGDETLGIVDPRAEQQIATVAEGGTTGHEVAASPDGRTAYVPIYGNSGVGKPGTDGRNMIVVDIASRKVVGNVDFGHGVRPHCAVIGPKDGMLYVTTELEKTISVIDPRTLKIVGAIPTGQAESHMLAITPDGKRGYTANVGPGTVSVLDMENRKTITVIPVAGEVQRIALSPDGKMAFTSDQTKPQLAVIETATNKVKTWIPLPDAGLWDSADTRRALVGCSRADGQQGCSGGPQRHESCASNRCARSSAGSSDAARRPSRLRLVRCQPQGCGDSYFELDGGKVDRCWSGADGLAWAGH